MIGAFRSSLFRWILLLAVRFFAALLLLCFLIVAIPASGISIPLSLLMLLGWSLMWIASLTLHVYNCGSRSINFSSSQRGGGLGTGESDVSVMLLYPVFHRSSSLTDVNFAAFMGNNLNDAILFSRSFGRTRWDLSVDSTWKQSVRLVVVGSGEVAPTNLCFLVLVRKRISITNKSRC